MKILAFSDLHGVSDLAADLVTASAGADLVIGAGDFCTMRRGLDAGLALLDGITAPMILIPGNAESAQDLHAAVRPGVTVLHGTGCEFNGLRLFGLGYGVPPTPFGDWSCDMSEDAAEAMLARCEQADILILHSPPKGLGDVTSSGLSIGSVAIRDAIMRIQPKLAVFGHVHECWGTRGAIGNTQAVNLGPTPNWFDTEVM